MTPGNIFEPLPPRTTAQLLCACWEVRCLEYITGRLSRDKKNSMESPKCYSCRRVWHRNFLEKEKLFTTVRKETRSWRYSCRQEGMHPDKTRRVQQQQKKQAAGGSDKEEAEEAYIVIGGVAYPAYCSRKQPHFENNDNENYRGVHAIFRGVGCVTIAAVFRGNSPKSDGWVIDNGVARNMKFQS